MQRDWEPEWKDGVGWQVDFTVEGQRIRRRLGIRDESLRAVARKKAQTLYKEAWAAALSEDPVSGSPLFFEAATAYIKSGGEARFLPPLIRHFGATTTIEEIDEATIVAAGLDIYPHAKPDTRRRQVRVPINAVIRHAQGHRRQPSTDSRRVRWLTPEEAERLIDAARRLTLPRHALPERHTLAKIAALLGTGMRTGECFAADMADFNQATAQLWISGKESGAGKTALSARWVRFPRRALDLMGELPSDGRMFRTPYGKPIVMRKNGGGQMAAAFNKARDAAGLDSDVTPHVLRHTWATWFYAQTRDYGQLKDLGGWAKADTAERYRKTAPDDLADRLLAHGWDFRTLAQVKRDAVQSVRRTVV